jgi:hypothetical protein
MKMGKFGSLSEVNGVKAYTFQYRLCKSVAVVVISTGIESSIY